MAFQMRTTKPETNNKYYITKSAGGWSNAIVGSPKDGECNVLANCVGYAYGRFNEIGGYGSCKYLAPVNAENFIQYKGTCEVSRVPSVGACMVWRKGATLSGSDGAGHVAIVERVDSSTQVYTSESGYGSSKPFWNSTRTKGSGNWGAGAGYTFLGFIVNPAIKSEPAPSPSIPEPAPSVSEIKMGDIVSIIDGATYYSGGSVPSWVKSQRWKVASVAGGRAVIDKNEVNTNSINSPINVKYLKVVGSATPVAPPAEVGPGSKVKIKPGSKWYGGSNIPGWVMTDTWIVSSVNGDRAVIDKNVSGKNSIMSPINKNNLTLV